MATEGLEPEEFLRNKTSARKREGTGRKALFATTIYLEGPTRKEKSEKTLPLMDFFKSLAWDQIKRKTPLLSVG